MQYIVTFKEKVKNDYNCRWREHEYHSIRFNTYEEARNAAADYIKTIPELPYRRSATVFNGPLITCQWTAYFESKIIKYIGAPTTKLKAPFKFAQIFNMIF